MDGSEVDVGPGETMRLEPPAPIEPGDYRCFYRYHRAQGMVATLCVEE